jgi:predicted transcriptional regulator
MPNLRDGDVQLISYLPRDLRREFKHFATERDTSMSRIVREAIEKMVRERDAAEASAAPQSL